MKERHIPSKLPPVTDFILRAFFPSGIFASGVFLTFFFGGRILQKRPIFQDSFWFERSCFAVLLGTDSTIERRRRKKEEKWKMKKNRRKMKEEKKMKQEDRARNKAEIKNEEKYKKKGSWLI